MTGKQDVSMCDRVIRALSGRGVALSLCDCGVDGRKWEVFDRLGWIDSNERQTAVTFQGWSVSSMRAPMAMLSCNGCGQTRFYSATFLGIVDSKGDLTTALPDPSPASGKVGP